MRWSDWVLVVHIAAVAAWLGANFVQAALAGRVRRADPVARLWWVRTQGDLARVYYSVAGVVVLLSGIALVLDDQRAGEFSSAFVSIGFAAIIIGVVLGVAVFGPGSRRIAAAIEAGDGGTERSVDTRLAIFGVIDTLVVLVTIAAMVGHWGA